MIKPYIATMNGGKFYYNDISNNVFDVEEVAFALSNLCRFNGHCRSFYSVAQHSVFVAELCPEWLYGAGLFHDAAEAFIGDIPTTLKQMLPEYKHIQKQVDNWVALQLNLEIDHPFVKYADLQALAAEKRDLINDPSEWDMLSNVITPKNKVHPVPPTTAFLKFMNAYENWKGSWICTQKIL